MASLRIGVDSGGTFTDVCILDEESGRISVWKLSSTPSDPSVAISAGASEAIDRYQPVEKGVIDRVSPYVETYRGEGGFAILRDDEDDLSDQDGSSGGNKHEQGAISPRHGLFRGAGADELAHQQ